MVVRRKPRSRTTDLKTKPADDQNRDGSSGRFWSVPPGPADDSQLHNSDESRHKNRDDLKEQTEKNILLIRTELKSNKIIKGFE